VDGKAQIIVAHALTRGTSDQEQLWRSSMASGFGQKRWRRIPDSHARLKQGRELRPNVSKHLARTVKLLIYAAGPLEMGPAEPQRLRLRFGFMSYIVESLAAHESLIYRARFHWLQKTGAYVALAVFLAMAAACLALTEGLPALIGASALTAFGVIVFAGIMVPMWTTEIGVTNQRFIFKRGWLRRTTDELQLTSIEEVNLEQGALGRIFGYGRLVLHGTGVNDISLPPLADPVGLRRAVQEGMGAAKTAVVVAPPQPSDGAPLSATVA
jgi:hypothetical protein